MEDNTREMKGEMEEEKCGKINRKGGTEGR